MASQQHPEHHGNVKAVSHDFEDSVAPGSHDPLLVRHSFSGRGGSYNLGSEPAAAAAAAAGSGSGSGSGTGINAVDMARNIGSSSSALNRSSSQSRRGRGFLDMGEDKEMEALIPHERAHKDFDYNFMCVGLFFHPFVARERAYFLHSCCVAPLARFHS